MVLDSSSKHHATNMRLLIVILTCLAACSALPVEKQKRDILPGDPRYGTDHHHHHHENVIEDTRTSNGYSYTLPKLGKQVTSVHTPLNNYGPPGFQPGVPLNGNHLPPTTDVIKFSTPVPNFDVANSAQVRQLTNTYIPAPNTEVKKTVTTTSFAVPVEKTKTLSVSPPSTSYGTPVVHHTKATLDTASDSHITTTLKTVKTEVQDQQVVDLPTPSVKVIEHAPVAQGVTHVTTGVKNVPAVTTTVTKNVHTGTLFTENLPTFQSFEGVYGQQLPSYGYPSYSPSVYTNYQPSYRTLHSGFTGLGADCSLGTLNHQVHQPLRLATQFANTFPSSYSFAQTAQLPQTYQFPQGLPHVVNQVQPVHSLKTVQSYSPVETLTHVQPAQPVHSVKTVQSYSPVETLTHVEPAQPVHSVKTVQSYSPVETLTHVEPAQPVHSVKTVQSYSPAETLTHAQHGQPLHSVKTVQSYSPAETLTRVQPVHSVKTVQSYSPVETLTHVEPVKSVHTADSVSTLETLTPVHKTQSVEVLPSVQSQHTVVESVHTKTTPVVHSQVQKGPIGDFFQNLSENLSFPSLPSLPSFPSLPSLPGLPSFPSSPTTVATPVELSSPISTQLIENKDTITVENPLLPSDNNLKGTVVQHVTPVNDYVQPTAANGGYVY